MSAPQATGRPFARQARSFDSLITIRIMIGLTRVPSLHQPERISASVTQQLSGLAATFARADSLLKATSYNANS